MASFLRWIITLPVLIAGFVFAVSNPSSIDIVLNPLAEAPNNMISVPIYIIAFVALGIGFLLGIVVLWLSMGKVRLERRQYKKAVKKLEKEISEMNDRVSETLSANDSNKNDIAIENEETI